MMNRAPEEISIKIKAAGYFESGKYPQGWGAYSYAFYRRDFIKNAAEMLEWVDDLLKEKDIDLRIVAIDYDDHSEQKKSWWKFWYRPTYGNVSLQLARRDGTEI